MPFWVSDDGLLDEHSNALSSLDPHKLEFISTLSIR